jgi:cell volume regulation protein A
MADTWVSLLIAGTILLVGFAAYLLFQRYRIPDFFVLMILGAVLGVIPVAPFGPGLLASLGSLLPVFTNLTIAFILFEGGLSLRPQASRRQIAPMMAHIVGAVALTMLLVWFFATRLFGLGEVAALILAAAFSSPSASIALSFAPRMHLSERAEGTIILEGVLTNVIAAMGVLFAIQWYGPAATGNLLLFVMPVAAAAGFAVLLGVAWRLVGRRLQGKEFLYIASTAMAVVVYAAAQGLFGGNGAVAVFVFGVVLVYRKGSTREGEELHAYAAEFRRPVEPLKSFQSEVTFALRTFFFVYLGVLLISQLGSTTALFAGLIFTAVFVLGRAPTSFGVGRALRLPKREQRVVLAAMGRGMTDVILILLALQSGVIPAAEGAFILEILPTTVLISAIVCALLLVWADLTRPAVPTAEAPRPTVEPQPPVQAPSEPSGGK